MRYACGMRQSTALLPLLLATALACSGIGTEDPLPAEVSPPDPTPAPVPEPDAPDEDEGPTGWIDEAIEMETMPGTSGDESEERMKELRAFFLAHPEYEDPAELEKLADLACGYGLEEAHVKLHDPEPRTPRTVTVEKPGWKLMVAYSEYHCTSDDWSWFTNEVREAVSPKGVGWDYAGATHDVLVVKLGDEEVQRVPLEGQGYLMLHDGKDPQHAGHDMPEGVIEAAQDAFGL